MVLNIRKREINELMENYLNPLMEIKNFNLVNGIRGKGFLEFDIFERILKDFSMSLFIFLLFF